MAGYPGEMSEPDPGVRTRPRRSVLPWILTFASLTFALGLLANPWFEREIRSRLPFGGGSQVADAPQAGAREASTPLAAEDRKVAAATVLASTADAEEEVKARLAQAERLAALEKRFEALDARSGMALANSARAEGMLITLAARRAVDTGQSLGVIEGMLRERFGGTQPQAVAALIAASQQPVTLSQLQAGLQTLEPQLQHAAQGGSWWSELSSDIAGLILFKRESEPVMQPIEQLRDARQRLSMGDVAGALWQIGRLPEGARAKAAAWRAAARRYLSAHQALDTLETVALLSPPPGQKEQVIPLPSAPPAPTPAENAEPAPRG
ncbi:hypothetical protein BSL82_12150 [Tardibacter chloracetimidivorans]|uniref:Uncharacterized protein n=1 Tax=Tardibacter chloracetimidivorans TaxID=1921510 RepID=A0A1L3ZWF9_9SPHN|nr:hypothetical protein [Tardibacter chloracetimidivorans]API59968.1 hypothetical protein BSL82_12150 [Tardibacter chloracetimidivorans]